MWAHDWRCQGRGCVNESSRRTRHRLKISPPILPRPLLTQLHHHTTTPRPSSQPRFRVPPQSITIKIIPSLSCQFYPRDYSPLQWHITVCCAKLNSRRRDPTSRAIQPGAPDTSYLPGFKHENYTRHESSTRYEISSRQSFSTPLTPPLHPLLEPSTEERTIKPTNSSRIPYSNSVLRPLPSPSRVRR